MNKINQKNIPLIKKVISLIPETVLLMDSDGQILFINSANSFIFKNESVGKHWSQIIPKKMNSPFQRAMRKADVSDKRICFKQSTQDGRMWNICMVTMGSGSKDLIRVVHFDEITESLSRESNPAKLTGNLSHEIRTPLTGILGLTNLMLETEMTPIQREYLSIIQKTTDNMLSLVNDILDISKIEAQKLSIESTEFNLRESLFEVLHGLTVRASLKGLELICDMDEDVPDWLVGDKKRGMQILTNLVGNALKFTEEGEVVVKVFIDPNAKKTEDTLLHFTVMDTGVGIAKENQRKIFEAFTQAESSENHDLGGTGLGLTISSQLVHLLGGEIWLESPVKKPTSKTGGPGCAFHFTLPLISSQRKTDIRESETSRRLKDVSILVAEDNETVGKLLKDLFSKLKMKPRFVHNGREALAEMNRAIIDGARYPLALIDSEMPEKNGFDVAEQVRWDSELAGNVVLMLSPMNIKQDIVRCTQIGITHHLVKPLNIVELVHTLSDAYREQDKHPIDANSPEMPEPDPIQFEGDPAMGQREVNILLLKPPAVNHIHTETYLDRKGWRTVSVNSDETAIRILSVDSADMVLIDVEKDQMIGLDTIRFIHQQEVSKEIPDLPVIVMIDEDNQTDKQMYVDAGVDDFITKPVHREGLCHVVERHIKAPVRKRILVIEDSPAFQKMIEAMLEKNGFEVLIASDGLEGFNKVRAENPDLVIMDLLLPQMDGHEVIRLLKMDSTLSKIPIIMFTQRNLEEDIRLAREGGADAYILKSNNPNVLLKKINQLLK